MVLRTNSYSTLVVAFAISWMTGCSDESTPSTPAARSPAPAASETANSRPTPSSPTASNHAAETVAPTSQATAPTSKATVAKSGRARKRRGKQIELPKVVLSQQHAATCRVQVGDTMPDMSIVNTDGELKKLNTLMGDRVTVVCFWDAENPLSRWQLAALGPEVVERFGSQGVNVVAINRGQSVQEARQEADKAGVKFPVLVDEDGRAYDQVATRYLPRTYLMDGDGKILWLDLGYSDDTRRHLKQAIHFALATDTAGRGTMRQ